MQISDDLACIASVLQCRGGAHFRIRPSFWIRELERGKLRPEGGMRWKNVRGGRGWRRKNAIAPALPIPPYNEHGHSVPSLYPSTSNYNLSWRHRKPGLSSIPSRNNAEGQRKWQNKVVSICRAYFLCRFSWSCAYLIFHTVDFKTHKASLPWTSAPQARSEHYSQACHLSLPQTQWTRYSCWDWEAFDVTPPHHVTMRPICYSESSTEKQDTSILE